MTTGERLAAYLSGDLDPAQRAALEADLAGDAALRDQLETIRTTDAALADLGDVDLPEGFSSRLRDRLAPEVDAVLGDELAGRRARRSTGRWLAVTGATAAVVAVVAVGVSILGGMGASDTAGMADEDSVTADGGGADSAEMAEEGAGDAEAFATGPQAASAPVGPRVVDDGREVDASDLAQLAEDEDLRAAVTSDTVQSDPAAAAQAFTAALGASDLARLSEDAEREAADESLDTAPLPGPPVATEGAVSEQDLEDVAACLPVLSDDAAAPVVPLYAELATNGDGDDVIVYAALSPDSRGEYRRVEVWVIARGSCEMRLFSQYDTAPAAAETPDG